MLLHISSFQLDIDSQRASPWHQLVPQTRVLCALLFVFATALTPNGHWWTWTIYAIGLAIGIRLSRSTLSVLLKRVAIESTFLGVVLLGTLFRQGGTVLWQWGSLQITTLGLMILGSVAFKALLCLLMLNLLVLTTPVPALLNALIVLKVPPLLVAILASMYRYIAVLIEEFQKMRQAATARNLMRYSRWQRLIMGNMIGSLFIRTYERGDRIHQAMLSRGYTGLPPAVTFSKVRQPDIKVLTLTVIWLLLGQIIYL